MHTDEKGRVIPHTIQLFRSLLKATIANSRHASNIGDLEDAIKASSMPPEDKDFCRKLLRDSRNPQPYVAVRYDDDEIPESAFS